MDQKPENPEQPEQAGQTIDFDLPEGVMPVLPLRDVVVYPHMVIPEYYFPKQTKEK